MAIGLFRLFVSGSHQGAVVFCGKGLPVEVEGSCESRLAGAFAATVLVDYHAADCLYARWNPEGVVDWKNEFARTGGCLVADPVVGSLGGGKYVVGGLLCESRSRKDGEGGEWDWDKAQGGGRIVCGPVEIQEGAPWGEVKL